MTLRREYGTDPYSCSTSGARVRVFRRRLRSRLRRRPQGSQNDFAKQRFEGGFARHGVGQLRYQLLETRRGSGSGGNGFGGDSCVGGLRGEGNEEKAETIGVSLYEITGQILPQKELSAMTVRVKMKKESLVFLINSESIYSFIQEEVARKMGLDYELRRDLRATIAHGDSIKCGGVSLGVPIQIGDYS
ncbi:hypothetical protein M569_16802 [Genlisea aurea]|uniref:Uncharacterized protein n=1 Tax=Genlisea aurea TaxID=192259 RepID=S8BTV2_9LAMI|nr:hypothetical protein M569_16802 [Genlisea aurea]